MESASEFLADIEKIEVNLDGIDFSNIWESSKIKSSNLIGVTNDKGKELVEDAASKASSFSKNIKSWLSED